MCERTFYYYYYYCYIHHYKTQSLTRMLRELRRHTSKFNQQKIHHQQVASFLAKSAGSTFEKKKHTHTKYHVQQNGMKSAIFVWKSQLTESSLEYLALIGGRSSSFFGAKTFRHFFHTRVSHGIHTEKCRIFCNFFFFFTFYLTQIQYFYQNTSKDDAKLKMIIFYTNL